MEDGLAHGVVVFDGPGPVGEGLGDVGGQLQDAVLGKFGEIEADRLGVRGQSMEPCAMMLLLLIMTIIFTQQATYLNISGWVSYKMCTATSARQSGMLLILLRH